MAAVVGPGSWASASLVWELTNFEYRASPGEESVTASFPFRAEGKTVTIQGIRSSCGCTTAKLEKRTYAPGEVGSIVAIFDFGARVGQQVKTVVIQTDDPNQPSQELSISAYIPQILRLEPRFVYWSKGADEYLPQVITLRPDTEEPVRMVDITSDTGQLDFRLEPMEDGSYRLHVVPLIPEGDAPFFRSIIRVEVDADFPLKQRVFHAYAFMRNP
jgi:hypothetical protein